MKVKKYINPHHKITPWVALVIIAAISATLGYFIWTSANESWGYEYIYPQIHRNISTFLTNVETVGWHTYKDDEYGFQLRHPAKYSGTVGDIVANSVLGTSANPVAGTSIGPLIFVKAEGSLRALADAQFDVYWNFPGENESPTSYCAKQTVPNDGLEISMVSCLIGGKKENYALIKGKTFDIFVDGYTDGYDQRLQDAYGAASKEVTPTELLQILSTFKFL